MDVFFGLSFLFLRPVESGWTRNGGYVEEMMDLPLAWSGGGGEQKRHDRRFSVVSVDKQPWLRKARRLPVCWDLILS